MSSHPGRTFPRVTLCVLLFAALLAGPPGAARGESPDELREWTVNKVKVRARLVSIAGGKLLLENEKRIKRAFPLSQFPEDQRKEALIRAIGSGVVVVQSFDTFDKPAGVGSGFVFQPEGYILTNYHVIRGAASLKVEFRDAEGALAADCLAVDPNNDVAILKVADLPPGTQVIELDWKERPHQGDAVWTIGHPQRLKNTVSWGDVNAVRQTDELPEDLREDLVAAKDAWWVQTDAVLSQGSSGGPLLNRQGQAVGMNTFIAGPQLGFALHIAHAAPVFMAARTAKPLSLPLAPRDDESALAWLSREVAPIVKRLQEEMEGLKTERLTREQAIARYREIGVRHRDDLLAIARKDPAGWPGFQALAFSCGLATDESDDSRKCLDEICNLLLTHHANSRDLANLASRLAERPGEEGVRFARALLEQSPHHEVKAEAAAALAYARMTWVSLSGGMDLKATESARDEVDRLCQLLEGEFAEVKFDTQTAKEYAHDLRERLADIRIGAKVPEISGVDMDGKKFKLSDFHGKVILLDFFADWCPYCRQMYPAERQLVESMKEKPFALVGVNCDNQQVLMNLVERKVVTWRTFADGAGGPIATEWEINSFPNLYLVDHNGIVRRLFRGVPSEESLQEAIATLVREAEQAKQNGS